MDKKTSGVSKAVKKVQRPKTAELLPQSPASRHSPNSNSHLIDSQTELSAQLELATTRIAELETARVRAETLFAITQVLGKTLNLQDTFNVILGELQKVVPYDSASVQVTQNNRLVIVGGRGFNDLQSLLGVGFDLDDNTNPGVKVLHTRQPQVFSDVSKHPHFQSEVHGGGKIRGWIGVPLIFGDRVIGVITLDKFEPDFYNVELAELAMAFAAQAATAIENARLFAETQQRFRETEILRAANIALTKTFDPDTILGTLLEYLHQVVPYDTGSVFLLEGDKRLTAFATRGYENWLEDPAQAIGVSFDFTNMPHICAVVEDQLTFVIPDVTQFPGWVAAETAGHIRNWLAVPLIAAGKTIGMYSLDKVEPNYFTPEHQRLAENLATQAAIAIQNATLFRNQKLAREHAETLQAVTQSLSRTLSLQEVFDLILTELHKVVPYDSCSVQQLEGEYAVIVGGRGFTNLNELLGLRFLTTAGDLSSHVINARQPYIVDDVSASFQHFRNREHGAGSIHGWMGVPLIFGDRLIGMLALDKHEAFFYKPEHAQMAMAFAAQAATAIENARLFETERIAREQAETLRAAALALGSTLSLRQVFELILSELRKVVPYDSCSVQQLDGDEMNIVGGYGFPNLDELIGNRFNWRGPDDPAGEVATRREPVIIADVSARFEHFKDEMHGRGRIHGWMGVPLLFGDRLIGMLTLDKFEKDFYTAEHARVAQAFASQAANAIENARLFDETREARTAADRANQAKSAFLATMSHELRTPLNAIIGFTRIVRKKAEGILPEKQTENLDKVLSSAEHLLGLINTVLDIAKIEAGRTDVQVANFSINALVDQCANLAIPLLRPAIQLEKKVDETIGLIHSDQDKIKQIVLNLLSNAAKFTHEGNIVLGAEKADTNVRIYVTDSGIGISDEALSRVFEEFQQADTSTTRKYGGTGLGLSISRNLARLLGGDLTVTSELGKGSTFSLIVPMQFQSKAVSISDSAPPATQHS